MNRTAALVLAVVVVAFLAVGGFLVFRGTGGGGKAVTIDLKVTGASMTPDSPSARQNDTLTINVTTDKAEEIHLHGYNIMFAGEPGKTITHTFKADKSGQFEIEIESTSTHLGFLTVNP